MYTILARLLLHHRCTSTINFTSYTTNTFLFCLLLFLLSCLYLLSSMFCCLYREVLVYYGSIMALVEAVCCSYHLVMAGGWWLVAVRYTAVLYITLNKVNMCYVSCDSYDSEDIHTSIRIYVGHIYRRIVYK